ncbi:MAG: hypothetical protein ABSG21_15455 [Spirochaetia bacterium]|jgi:hypothetical protein
MNIHVSIQAHPRYLIVTDAAALILVELALFVVSRIRSVMSPLAFLLLGAAVFAGFAADVGCWYWKGIRSAEITGEALILHRGLSFTTEAFQRTTLKTAKISRLPGSRKARLRTSSGRRVRITENAFRREEFSRFLTAMEAWAFSKNQD